MFAAWKIEMQATDCKVYISRREVEGGNRAEGAEGAEGDVLQNRVEIHEAELPGYSSKLVNHLPLHDLEWIQFRLHAAQTVAGKSSGCGGQHLYMKKRALEREHKALCEAAPLVALVKLAQRTEPGRI